MNLERLTESEAGEEKVVLKSVADPPPVSPGDRLIVDGDSSGVVKDSTHQGVQQRRLSSSCKGQC